MHIIQMVQEQHAIYFGYAFFRCFRLIFRVEPDTRLKRVSGTDKALLPSTSIIRVIRVNICARIEYKFSLGS